jgi:hypothetical protein
MSLPKSATTITATSIAPSLVDAAVAASADCAKLNAEAGRVYRSSSLSGKTTIAVEYALFCAVSN